MKELILLAWKNLMRYKRRTIITASAIGFGLSIFIFMDCMLRGIMSESENNLIKFETAGAKIFSTSYDFQEPALLNLIPDPTFAIDELESLSIPYTTRIAFPGQLLVTQAPYSRGSNMNISAVALDPETDGNVFDLNRAEFIEGKFLKNGEDGIIIGDALARKIGAKTGNLLSLYTKTAGGAQQIVDLNISGIYKTGNPIVNSRIIYITLETAKNYLDTGSCVSEIALKIPHKGNAYPKSIRKLEKSLPGYQVQGWDSIASKYKAVSAGDRGGNYLLLFLICIIAAIGVTNTMMMAVFERTPEIGMMKALGMKDFSIWMLFLLESVGIGIIGSVSGVIMGFFMNLYMIYFGISYGSNFTLEDQDIGYRISGLYLGEWNPDTMLLGSLAAILICVLMAMIPSARVLKKKIPDCLREAR